MACDVSALDCPLSTRQWVADLWLDEHLHGRQRPGVLLEQRRLPLRVPPGHPALGVVPVRGVPKLPCTEQARQHLLRLQMLIAADTAKLDHNANTSGQNAPAVCIYMKVFRSKCTVYSMRKL